MRNPMKPSDVARALAAEAGHKAKALEALLPETLDPEARAFASWVLGGADLLGSAACIRGLADADEEHLTEARLLLRTARALVAGSYAASEADLNIREIAEHETDPSEEASALLTAAQERMIAIWGPAMGHMAATNMLVGLLGRTRAFVVTPVEAMVDVPAIRSQALRARYDELLAAIDAALAIVTTEEA